MVVDDGSTDDSRDRLRSWSGRVEVILQENRGHPAACLEGARRLGREVVIFLDADDLLAPNAVRTVARCWRLGSSKLQYRMEVIDGEGRRTGIFFPKYPRESDHPALVREMLRTGRYPSPPTSGNAYAVHLLDEIQEPYPFRFIDTILNTIAPFRGEVTTIPDVLACYRLHGANAYLMGRLDAERIRRRLDDETKRLEFLVRYARRHGIELEHELLVRASAYCGEHRLALARVAGPGERDRPGRAGAMLALARGVLASGDDLRLKLTRLLWTFAVGLGPAGFARSLIDYRLVPTTRSPRLEKLIRRFVGAR